MKSMEKPLVKGDDAVVTQPNGTEIREKVEGLLRNGLQVVSLADAEAYVRGADIPWRRVAATLRLRRGYSVATSRGDAAAATWTFRGGEHHTAGYNHSGHRS